MFCNISHDGECREKLWCKAPSVGVRRSDGGSRTTSNLLVRFFDGQNTTRRARIVRLSSGLEIISCYMVPAGIYALWASDELEESSRKVISKVLTWNSESLLAWCVHRYSCPSDAMKRRVLELKRERDICAGSQKKLCILKYLRDTLDRNWFI